jgi:hypothetical protein
VISLEVVFGACLTIAAGEEIKSVSTGKRTGATAVRRLDPSGTAVISKKGKTDAAAGEERTRFRITLRT